ncbi:hypothetical protein [Streptomyces sp. NPDC015130]|uniref:hypothetical protein n=1 Tax=Streptomyces sp. NPDC015130 TaxID=3364940 RepID=UPI0036F65395
MTLVTRDPATGLSRNPIRYPDGQPPTPYGCRWCGTEQGGHGRRWKPGAGLHVWEQPTDAQILARMRARRTARLAGPAPLHATTAWAPDPDGESADSYCRDCGTSACPRWWRIDNRLQLRRQGLRRWPRNDVPF